MAQVSPRIVSLIKSMEGFSDKSYVDATGRSIGYGHFIQPGEQLEGRSLSKDEAEKLLEQDIKKHQDPWIGKLTADIGEEGVAALTSFAYNVGAHGKGINEVVGLINAGKKEEAAEFMQQYNKSKEGGVLQVNKALVERRDFEGKLLLGGKVSDDLGEKWSKRGGIVSRVGRMITGESKTTKASSYADINQGTNALVLQGLRELNSSLGAQAANEDQERAWSERVMQEARGWRAS